MRHSNWDALLVALSVAHAVVLFAAPTIPVIALGLWWNSNTISHNFIHLPFFRSQILNRAYSIFLTLLLGIPQSFWRRRHFAHHAWPKTGRLQAAAGFSPRFLSIEEGLVFGLFAFLVLVNPRFFLFTYLPGYVMGLSICYIHGYFEHARGTVSNYGLLYNLAFFNDGYHDEHHLHPAAHWTRLPQFTRTGASTSRWPAVLRWIETFNLELLERIVLRSKALQAFMLKTHERAFRAVLPKIGRPARVKIVGGGMFPRTALILQKLLPDAQLTIVDASSGNLETAKRFLNGRVEYVNVLYQPAQHEDADLVVIPLAFRGDRRGIYAGSTTVTMLVHDWLWSTQADGARISLLLLKRLNLVRP